MSKKVTFFAIGLLVAFTTIQAQTWTQIGADIDGKLQGDESGWSVSMSSNGSVVAIGAPSNDAGHVRIYENQSGTWTQTGNDIAGEAEGDYFGYALSLSSEGSIVAAGATENDGNGDYAGHVRVFENQGGTWIQIGEDIDGEAGYDNSGSAVSLSSDGSVVAIGAHDNDGNGSYAGHVRVFENQGDAWIQIGEDIDGEAEYDYSGYSVSLNDDGSVVAIGAPWNESSGAQTGQVRVFENQSGTWTQMGEDIYGESEFDRSGYSVSLNSDGSMVAIGAPENDGSGEDAGHVRVYEYQSSTWTQVGDDIDGEAADDYFGSSVSLNSDGSVVAIGAPDNGGSGGFAGHARVYENQSGTWTQKGSDIDAEAAFDSFGTSLSLSNNGSIVAIGAPHNDGNGSGAGHVRVFEFIYTNIETLQHERIISIYPNPTKGVLYFNFINSLSSPANTGKIVICDITGKKIIEKTEIKQNETIDLSGFESGIYIINLRLENKIYITNIIKE